MKIKQKLNQIRYAIKYSFKRNRNAVNMGNILKLRLEGYISSKTMEKAVRKHTYEVIGFEDAIKSVKKINVNKIIKEVWKENEKDKIKNGYSRGL